MTVKGTREAMIEAVAIRFEEAITSMATAGLAPSVVLAGVERAVERRRQRDATIDGLARA